MLKFISRQDEFSVIVLSLLLKISICYFSSCIFPIFVQLPKVSFFIYFLYTFPIQFPSSSPVSIHIPLVVWINLAWAFIKMSPFSPRTSKISLVIRVEPSQRQPFSPPSFTKVFPFIGLHGRVLLSLSRRAPPPLASLGVRVGQTVPRRNSLRNGS